MKNQNDSSNIVTQTLENKKLEDAIREAVRSPSIKSMSRFINEFVSTSLIVLVSDYIHESADSFDDDGFFTLSQYDNIPLVKFEDADGQMVFPVFTNVEYLETLGCFEGYIPLIVPSIQVLEISQQLTCDKLVLNFESPEMIELDTVLRDSLIFRLISQGQLSTQNTFM